MIKKFQVKEAKVIKGLYEITPFSSEDERGAFVKDYSYELLMQNNILYELQEVFYTYSRKGVVRALHFQRTPQQGKLVRCISGKIYDVVVDLCPNSSSFLKYETFLLSGQNRKALMIPSHCAHGYLVLEESVVSYKCDQCFNSETDDGIYWLDSSLKIDWPLHLLGDTEPILSEKDKNLQSLTNFLQKYGGLRNA